MQFSNIKFIVISAHNPKDSRGMLAITFKHKKERDEFAKSSLSGGFKIEAHIDADNLAVIRLPIEGVHRKEIISDANKKKVIDALKKKFPKAYNYENKNMIVTETRHSRVKESELEHTVFKKYQEVYEKNQLQAKKSQVKQPQVKQLQVKQLPRKPSNAKRSSSWIALQINKVRQFAKDFLFAPSRHRIAFSIVGGSLFTAAVWVLGMTSPIGLAVAATASAATIYTGLDARDRFYVNASKKQVNSNPFVLQARVEGNKSAKGWTPYLKSQFSVNNWKNASTYASSYRKALDQQYKRSPIKP